MKAFLILVFMLSALATFSQTNYKLATYTPYIKGNLQEWKGIIDEIENKKSNTPDEILQLTEYEYGYIAWCIGNDKKKEAKKYLKLADKNLELLESHQSQKANMHAFNAAFYGFRIGINILRAPFYGSKSIKHAEQALEIDSTNFRANMEMGNIWNHMPKMFGGSDEKALVYYAKALRYIEMKPAEELKHNWMHLNLLAIYGQAHQKMGNAEKAMLYFEKALSIEPNFIWVKDELLPSLNQK